MRTKILQTGGLWTVGFDGFGPLHARGQLAYFYEVCHRRSRGYAPAPCLLFAGRGRLPAGCTCPANTARGSAMSALFVHGAVATGPSQPAAPRRHGIPRAPVALSLHGPREPAVDGVRTGHTQPVPGAPTRPPAPAPAIRARYHVDCACDGVGPRWRIYALAAARQRAGGQEALHLRPRRRPCAWRPPCAFATPCKTERPAPSLRAASHGSMSIGPARRARARPRAVAVAAGARRGVGKVEYPVVVRRRSVLGGRHEPGRAAGASLRRGRGLVRVVVCARRGARARQRRGRRPSCRGI